MERRVCVNVIKLEQHEGNDKQLTREVMIPSGRLSANPTAEHKRLRAERGHSASLMKPVHAASRSAMASWCAAAAIGTTFERVSVMSAPYIHASTTPKTPWGSSKRTSTRPSVCSRIPTLNALRKNPDALISSTRCTRYVRPPQLTTASLDSSSSRNSPNPAASRSRPATRFSPPLPLPPPSCCCCWLSSCFVAVAIAFVVKRVCVQWCSPSSSLTLAPPLAHSLARSLFQSAAKKKLLLPPKKRKKQELVWEHCAARFALVCFVVGTMATDVALHETSYCFVKESVSCFCSGGFVLMSFCALAF